MRTDAIAAGEAYGTGMIDTFMPRLSYVGQYNFTSIPTDKLALVTNATTARYFDVDPGQTTFTPRFPGGGTLTPVAGAKQLVFTDPAGRQILFEDFDPTLPHRQRGQFAGLTDPAGNETRVVARTPEGQAAEVLRTGPGGEAGPAESYLYTYLPLGDPNPGQVSSVTLQRRDAGAAWVTVRSVHYDYYDGFAPHGNQGDLKTATVKDGAESVIDREYYRYYTPGETDGYTRGLKYFFGPRSYDRLAAEVGDPAAATDEEVALYADNYFEYDAERRVKREMVQGDGCSACSEGLGEYTFSYEASPFQPPPAPDAAWEYNTWRTKTVETLPDGNKHVVFTNGHGQVLLKATLEAASGKEWATFYQYDGDGRAILSAEPSAVDGYDTNLPDLVGLTLGNAPHLRDGEGLVTRLTYSRTTNANETRHGSVEGYLSQVSIQRGETGKAVPQRAVTYFERTAGGVTVHPVATETVYRNDDGTGGQTTGAAYTWAAGSVRPATVTTTLPAATAAQNGPGTATSTTAVYDSFGRVTWEKDAAGMLTYTAYDPVTGAVVKRIADVNTAKTDDFAGLPVGWASPNAVPQHLTTAYEVDALGRPIKTTYPNGRVDYTAYDDTDHEVRTYPGWDHVTDRPTGPVTVIREDRAGNYTETLTMSATPNLAYAQDGAVLREEYFSESQPDPDWEFVGGTWQQSGGVMSQTGTANANLKKAVLDAGTWPADQEVEAKLRVDTWNPGAFAMAGVGVRTDPATGQGYNLVFGNGSVGFWNESLGGGNSYPFVWQVGTWYRFRLKVVGHGMSTTLLGKVWQDGTPEPAGWPYRQGGWFFSNLPTGAPALNSGASVGSANATVSFDNMVVRTATADRPAGTEAVSNVQSLARKHQNKAGQVVSSDAYFNLPAYATATPLGVEGTHFYRTEFGYGKRGPVNRTVSPAGTIYRTEYDALLRPVSEWVGTDDDPNSTDMVKVRSYEYDGGGVGDGNLTGMTEHPSSEETADRVTRTWYDWRNRPVAVKTGVETTEAADVNRPLTYVDYDNLGQPTKTRVYDGDGVTPTDADENGVPDAPGDSLVRTQSTAAFDELGRVYHSAVHGFNPQTGTVGGETVHTDVWYDARGQVVKTVLPDGLVEKTEYDGVGRAKRVYLTDGGGDAFYGDALYTSGDTVHTQTEYLYDPSGNVTWMGVKERFDGETGTGSLGSPTSGVRARVSYAGYYYDLADRPTAAVDVGNNGGANWNRPAFVPPRSDTVRVTSYIYGPDGLPQDVTDPNGITTLTTFDALGRVTLRTEGYGATEAFTVGYAYDAGGRLLSETRPGGRVTKYGYDVQERLSDVTERVGTAFERTTHSTYNRLGELVSVTDPAGTVTTYGRNVLGRVTAATEAVGLPIARTTGTAYDALGRTVSVTDPRGYVTLFGYDDFAMTASVTDPDGHATTTAFDPAGRPVSVTNPFGKTTETSYDRLGRVVAVSDPLDHATTFKYLVDGTTNTSTDPLTHTSKVVLDRFGQAASAIDAVGNTTGMTYDAGGRLTAVTNGKGVATAYAYDALDRVKTVTEAVGKTEERMTGYAYDADGDLVTVTDPLGRQTTFDHDTAGRVTTETRAAGTADAYTTVTGYDLLDRVTSVTRPGNRTTAYKYNELSQLTRTTDGVGTSLERFSAFDYDPNGNLKTVTDPLGIVTYTVYDKLSRPVEVYRAYGTTDQVMTATAYDKVGRVKSVTDARAHTTLFGYDDAGRRTSVTDAHDKVTVYGYDDADRLVTVTDPLSHVTTYKYDDADRLTSVIDPLTHAVSYGYDKAGNRTSVTDARNYTTVYGYDNLNRLVTVTNPLDEVTTFGYDKADNRTTVTNARKATWTTAYDDLNRVKTVTDPLTHATTYDYSPAGDLESVTDPLGKATAYGYDELGRQTTVTSRVGGVTTTKYDAGDRVVSVTDPLDHVTTFTYDKLNRVKTVTDPRKYVTVFGYDENGNRTWVEDARTNKTEFAYDKLDRLTTETDPFDKTTTYDYDDASRLVTITDRLGRRREFGYDDANRKTSEAWYSAADVLLQTQAFGYDEADNLTSATDPDGSYTITYDKLNRAESVVGPFGFNQVFAYDPAGNRKSVIDNKNGITTSEFDPANRLTSRAFTDGTTQVRLDYTYTDRDQVETVTRYADLTGTTKVGQSVYGYDDGARLTVLVHKNGAGGTLAEYGYAYDKADRLTGKTEDQVGTGYGYDEADQLTQDGAASHTYDETGNRTTAGYVTGDGNRLVSDGTWTYTYDLAGQLVKKSKGAAAETWTYAYDHRGQMAAAAKAATDGGAAVVTVSYDYDALGNRVGRTEADGAGATVAADRFAVDGWDPAKPIPVGTEAFDAVADLEADGDVAARRVYGTGFDELGVRVDADGAGWYLADRQGSVRLMAGSTGAVTGSRTYDAFGKVATTSGTGLDRYGYTGREHDDTIGWLYARGRMYDTATGRWTGEDPIGFAAGDPNLYRYVGNGPTNATDPSGLDWWSDNWNGFTNRFSSGLGRVVGSEAENVSRYVLQNPGQAATEFATGVDRAADKVTKGIGEGALEVGRVPLDVIGANAQNVLNAGAIALGSDTRFEYRPVSNTFQRLANAPTPEERIKIGLETVRDGGTFGMWQLGTAIGEYIRDGDADKFAESMGRVFTGLAFTAGGLQALENAGARAGAGGTAAEVRLTRLVDEYHAGKPGARLDRLVDDVRAAPGARGATPGAGATAPAAVPAALLGGPAAAVASATAADAVAALASFGQALGPGFQFLQEAA